MYYATESKYDQLIFQLTNCRPRSDLDSKTTITIDDRTFEVAADDLEVIAPLGRGAYGVVEKMRHRPSNTVLAVKVRISTV